jgi:hypothetical protein
LFMIIEHENQSGTGSLTLRGELKYF